jgi:hypothetical protein
VLSQDGVGRRSVPFQLPANWYRVTTEAIFDELESEFGPVGRDNAWKFLYATVAWFESHGGQQYLHLNDRLKSKAGQELARRGEEYLKTHFVPPGASPLEEFIDRIGSKYEAERARQDLGGSWQRNNVTGNAFEAALQVLVRRINGVTPSRQPALHTLRGFELSRVAYHSKPDLTLFSPRDFRLLISTKWTLRKERIGTYLHEAYFYRQRRADLQIAYVVSEFNLNILEWLVNDPLIDRVYHLRLPMLLDVHQPFLKAGASTIDIPRLLAPSQERRDYGRWLALSDRLFDLKQLFDDIDLLKSTESMQAVDPSDAADEEEPD